ncbi:amidohydrolase family protein [Paenibacillus eucommiae]|uniref:TIM-barrel fold metal-dependent hydrolase n=1 Tax=Paenibacillus eucommiae TaxID=1355755 RepID=A0ABS4J207_9BACL|nr:amidohydrolase family protein [Paenibacillus eucommiae]MBP1993860.1 putative TIM-barrel fold metal-dependent hydrolase [Paenibacillus eucommiae]
MNIRDLARNGLPLQEIMLIDMHCHIGAYNNLYIPYLDEDEQIIQYNKTMESVGVNYSAISMLRGLASGILGSNLDLYNYMQNDEKLLGWVTYIPSLVNESLDVAERCFALSKQYIGIKVHPEINRYPITDQNYIPMWEYANDKGLIVLAHAWGAHSEPSMFREIAATYTNTKILLGHCGGREPEISVAIQLANQFDNIYLDLNGAFIYSRIWLENIVQRADTAKILFSSDTMFNNICWEIGHVAFAKIPDSVKLDILGLNAKRLLAGNICKKSKS